MTEPTHSLALDTPESQHFDRKSLRLVTGGRADFTTLANDCVCFANGGGGVIAIGIEDGDVIHSVNGLALTSPDGMLEAWVRLRTSDRLHVELVRGGVARTHDVSIR